MAGWLTNGVAPVGALVQNGVTVSPPPITNLSARALLSVDTETPAGQQPQTAAATPVDIAALAVEFIYNSATSTAGAATLARNGGVILTEALTTAIGSSYTMTLTNSLVAAADIALDVQIHDVTNTAGQAQVTSVTNAAGSSVFIFLNTGTAAWNGTKAITFHR